MRAKEFIILESKSELDAKNAMNDIDSLGDTIEGAPERVKSAALASIKKINDSLKAVLAKLGSQAPVQEDAQDDAVRAELAQMKEMLALLQDSNATEQQKQAAINDIVKKVDVVETGVEKVIGTKDKAVQDKETAEQFIVDVSKYLRLLGDKIQGFELEDESEMSAQDKKNYRRKVINAKQFTETLKEALQGKIIGMLEKGDVNMQEIKDFLVACVNGDVIAMDKLIKTPQGNVDNFVNPEYKKVYDTFVKQNIFSYNPGTTGGAIGPGEMALSMMGSPTEKAKAKGDLIIDGVELEIKAGKTQGAGGRLNSKALEKATTGWQVWSKNIAEILAKAPSQPLDRTDTKGKVTRVIDDIKGWDGNTTLLSNKGKNGSAYNFSVSTLEALNKEVLEPYADPKQTEKLFVETIRRLVSNYDEIKAINPTGLIKSTIKGDGTVDIPAIFKAYTRIAYESYHLADGIDSIMFMNTDTRKYLIVKDGEDMVNKMGDLKVTSFTWNDDQQNPTPGYNVKI